MFCIFLVLHDTINCTMCNILPNTGFLMKRLAVIYSADEKHLPIHAVVVQTKHVLHLNVHINLKCEKLVLFLALQNALRISFMGYLYRKNTALLHS